MMVSAENDPRRAGTIWVLDLDEPIPAVIPRLKADFCQAGPDDVPALSAVSQRDASAEFQARFEAGRRCYTAWVGDQLAAYGWASFDDEKIGELNLRIRLLDGEAYIWDCVTAPRFRANHLYSALLAYIVKELRDQGWRRAWIGADLDNVASQKGIARAGYHHIADLVVARVLALRQVWVQGQPGVPEYLVDEARRAFLGDRDEAWHKVPSAARHDS